MVLNLGAPLQRMRMIMFIEDGHARAIRGLLVNIRGADMVFKELQPNWKQGTLLTVYEITYHECKHDVIEASIKLYNTVHPGAVAWE